MARVFIVNGPNLNLLGTRETQFYGNDTLAEIEAELQRMFDQEHALRFFQSNVEGQIINALHEVRNWAEGIVINPGAYTHYSYAIHDAIKAIRIPTVEVHLSNIHARDEFRHKSVIVPACLGQISGFGSHGYALAVTALLGHLSTSKSSDAT